MTDVVLKHGWDGEWFLRAYDFFGKKVGSKENKEAQIFIEPQGFCVMAGIGVEGGQAKKALDSVKERLDTQVRHRPATTRPTPSTTSSWARSPRTRPATRRTRASSATTTRG